MGPGEAARDASALYWESRYHDKLGFQYRSCHFENLCFDLIRHDFVIFLSNATQALASFPPSQFNFSTFTQPMVMSGIAPNIRTAKADMPRIISKTKATSYYWLNATWLAYQTFHTCNYGHVLWDTFLPIHTIIEMFHLMGDIFVTRLPFEGDCPSVYSQLEVPFFGIALSKRPFENINYFIPDAKSRYLCAREGATP